MTLTYIYHSGFMLETERCVLIFDYWMDPAGVVTKERLAGKQVYVFASHFHEDHFTKDIFAWRDDRPAQGYTYILSKDILRHRRALREQADAWLGKGATWQDDKVRVTAMGSNDSGVSWIVEVDGRRIFHAGDLCNWYARFLVDGMRVERIYSEDLGQYINPVEDEKRFLGELKDIRKVAEDFDLVMFPVDGRIGNGYTLGGRQFVERFRVGLFVPMHFTTGFESAWRMKPYCDERGIDFWSIAKEGDEIKMKN